MAGFTYSVEDLDNMRKVPLPIAVISSHLEEVRRANSPTIQLPKVVVKPPVAPPVQQPVPKQQPTVANPVVVPPKKGGCGCWGKK